MEKKENELQDAIETAASTFEKLGFERLEGRGGIEEVRLMLPSKYKEFYLGTYLHPNQRDLLRPGPNGDGLRWEDRLAKEYPEVVVRPVYRRNGAPEDVSVEIVVVDWHSTLTKTPLELSFMYERSIPGYAEAVRKYSPVDYLDPSFANFDVYMSGIETRTAKLRKNAGLRAIRSAVMKTVPKVEASFLPRDHSKFEKNPADFHAATYGVRRRPKT